MRRSLAIAGAAALACAAVGTPLSAQGSSVDQHSACMAGRVGAGIASPCDDGSAVYFSPAGLAMRPSAVGLNLTLIRASSKFEYHAGRQPPLEDNPVRRDPEVVPVPALWLSYRPNPRLAAAVGVFAPYGLGLEWPVCPTDDADCDQLNFEGRYTGYDNSLRSIYVQPTVAYQVAPGFSLGAGLDYVRLTIDVSQRADAPSVGLSGRDIADANLKGDGNALTGHVGAVLRLSPRTTLGARYLHSVKVDMDGDADFTQIATGTVFDAALAAQFAPGGPLADQAIATEIELPAQAVAGLAYRATDALMLFADYQWTGWKSFDQFDIVFENGDTTVLELDYRNTNTFRFAAEYGWNERLALRAGFRYNTAATPRATPFLPEGERNYYTVGLGYRVTPALSADLAFQYINQPPREGAVRPGGGRVGVYSSSGQVFGFTLAYRFGGGGAP
ncbi:MAG TPA: outer membrane protein transport protein [Longimicrobium sp.]|jgi:long-chain fatty acid transport protein